MVKNDHSATIKITDNGKGIPPEILSKLTQKGETYGKHGGSGLGLYHARSTVEYLNGSISIQSIVGQGTIVEITLPLIKEPSWFLRELKIKKDEEIVILDDDSSIHSIWDIRFSSAGIKNLIHFYNPSVFKNWMKMNDPKKYLFLFRKQDFL